MASDNASYQGADVTGVIHRHTRQRPPLAQLLFWWSVRPSRGRGIGVGGIDQIGGVYVLRRTAWRRCWILRRIVRRGWRVLLARDVETTR